MNKELKKENKRLLHDLNNKVFLLSEMEKAKCDLCGSSDNIPVLQENNTTMCKCRKCGLLYVTPRPTAKVLKEYYNMYYSSSETEIQWWKYRSKNKTKQAIDILNKIVPIKRDILDVGCGYGDFLKELFKNNKWREGLGIDYNKEGIEYAKKNNSIESLHYSVRDISDSGFLQPESFNVITLFAVLEHLLSPMVILKRTHQLLRKNGIVYINVPGAEFWMRLKQIFPMLPLRFHVPIHLYNFNKDSIYEYLTKTGFSNIEIQISAPEIQFSILQDTILFLSKKIASFVYFVTFKRYLSSICAGYIAIAQKKG